MDRVHVVCYLDNVKEKYFNSPANFLSPGGLVLGGMLVEHDIPASHVHTRCL